MKKIYLSEENLSLLREMDEEVTFYEFFTNMKEFLKDLLNKPYEAQPNSFFKKHGIGKDELIKKMKKIGLLKSKENITEVPIEEEEVKPKGKLRAKHTIQYLLPRKRFYEKAHELHRQLFGECKSVFSNEDEEIEKIKAMDYDGAYANRGGYKKL